VEIEKQVRMSIQDAVNRTSRKPFHWGGLDGYAQLQAIAQALHTLPQEAETAYTSCLSEDRGIIGTKITVGGWDAQSGTC
jgi:hypothetical protein